MFRPSEPGKQVPAPTTLEAVCCLAASIERVDSPDAGFLVSGFSEEDYAQMISEGSELWTTYQGEALAAFMLTCRLTELPATSWVRHHTGASSDIYVRQVATGLRFRWQGYAAALYQQLLESSECEYVYASVVVDPFNEASVRFHEAAGFRLCHVQTLDDGMTRGLYQAETVC